MDNTTDAGQNPALWVKLSGRLIPRAVRPMDIADMLYDMLYTNSRPELRPGDIFSIQYWGMIDSWILYCRDIESKVRIITKKTLRIDAIDHDITDFLKTNLKHPNGMRVSIHGLPLSVSEAELEAWVDSWAVRMGPVERAKEKASKAPRGCTLEPVYNGNRFCYISSFTSCIPRYSVYNMTNPLNISEFIDVDITVYVDSTEQTINCGRCKDHSHQYKDCPKGKPACHVCGEVGHLMSDCPNNHIQPFRGAQSQLSNFFKCDLMYENKNFPSSEHLFQWIKATYHEEPELAERVRCCDTPMEAKQLVEGLPVADSWISGDRLNAMCAVLDTKYNQSLAFRDALHDSGDNVLAEATGNTFWASGLGPHRTITTQPQYWPGQNKLGSLLMELRDHGYLMEDIHTTDGHKDEPVDQLNTCDVTATSQAQVAIALIDKAIDPSSTSMSSPELLSQADAIIDSLQMKPDKYTTHDRKPDSYELEPDITTTPDRKRKTKSPLFNDTQKRTRNKSDKQQHSIRKFFNTFKR